MLLLGMFWGNGRVNWDEFGIEEEGPVPALEDTETVVVPESPIRLSDENMDILYQAVSNVPSEENGIMAYLAAVTTIDRVLQ